jgi:outer membrane protein TolC
MGSRRRASRIPAKRSDRSRLRGAVTRTIPLLPLLAALLLPPAPAAAAPLTAQEAIRSAWGGNPALRAAASGVEGARQEARRASDGHLPTISLTARGVRTDEPMMAFGLKLDQGRIEAADFDPAKLNDPAAIGGWGASAAVQLPIYMGGRVSAGARAARAAADAEGQDLTRRREEVAAAVVEAYYGAQVAEQGLRFAEDLLAHAAETERFVRDRNAQGLVLDADLARAVAFRAQAQAERATALQRRASARSALALLSGPEAGEAELVSPVEAAPAPAAAPNDVERPDLAAARLRGEAAEAAADAARGALLPAVFAQAAVETMRSSDLSQGTTWTNLGVVARWDLSFADASGLRAARARSAAAASALDWKRREAAREADEGRRAVETADARVLAALEAVEASQAARKLREARHRQGLLPLTDVLDAEAGLAGARALLLASRLEARLARTRLALATHQPIEDLLP